MHMSCSTLYTRTECVSWLETALAPASSNVHKLDTIKSDEIAPKYRWMKEGGGV